MGVRVLIADRLRDAWAGLWLPWPLRAYLLAFGCALILPGILFGALGIVAFASYDRAAWTEPRSILHGYRPGADRQLPHDHAVRALAASETLEQGDLAGFYTQAKRVLSVETQMLSCATSTIADSQHAGPWTGSPPRAATSHPTQTHRARRTWV